MKTKKIIYKAGELPAVLRESEICRTADRVAEYARKIGIAHDPRKQPKPADLVRTARLRALALARGEYKQEVAR